MRISLSKGIDKVSIYEPEKYSQVVSEDDIYAGLLTGEPAELNLASHITLLDPGYSRLYVNNLYQHLIPLHLPGAGGVLDMGCGAGAVTAAFCQLFTGPVWGIDMYRSAITYAQKKFDGPIFESRSADQLDNINDCALTLVHAREFYPFSRTNDTDLHMRFLNTARPKLVTNGLFAVVQVRDPNATSGIHANFRDLQTRALNAGYRRSGILVMTPQKIFRRFGQIGHYKLVRLALSLAGSILEATRPGRVTYIYWFQV